MFTVISRLVHYGLKDFWRHGWLSVTTVIIMTLALLVSIGLIIFNVVTKQTVASIQDKIDISVYFKNNAPEDEIFSIKKSLENLSEVKTVQYLSSDEALEIFKENHKNDPTITQALGELNENPLQASLNIKANHPEQYASIAQYLSSPNLNTFIDEVSYQENHVVIERLTAMINGLNQAGLFLTIVMALVAGLVAFNTVRLAIYSNREEIGVMRVVGASNSFVRGPFVLQGIFAGVLAAIASVLISAILIMIGFALPSLKFSLSLLGLTGTYQFFFSNIFVLFGYQMLFGTLIGGFSSFIAVRRYLKN
ncbi:MAG: ABC transporter permease [Candidatus Liptonbacteria bacterium]|nr:ABC transporter permease [Candidatus Liptonbacteria bacterium]